MEHMSIANFFSGTLVMENTYIHDMYIKSGMFVMFNSELEMTSVEVRDITHEKDDYPRFFLFETSSEAKIYNSTFSGINFELISVSDSSVQLYDTQISNITSLTYIFECYRSEQIIFDNLTVYDSETEERETMFSFRECTIDSITNSNFTENQPIVARFIKSELKVFDNNVMDAMNQGMLFMSSSNATITNSVIKNMVQNIKVDTLYSSSIKHNGGAIRIVDSNVNIDNSVFSNNTAISGGAIYIDCSYLDKCHNSISNTVFEGNIATSEGGAISYNSFEPVLENITYSGNVAYFRDDISSYSTKIMRIVDGELVDIYQLDDIPSGLEIDEHIQLAIVDAEGSIMKKDSSSVIKLSSFLTGSEVRGQTTVGVKEGIANFTSTIFYSSPGAREVEYLLVSSAINYKAVQALDPIKYADHKLKVNFRWCKPGEIQIDDYCNKCTIGTYSVRWNETECRS